jgi:CDGSH-type Zn-finger protein
MSSHRAGAASQLRIAFAWNEKFETFRSEDRMADVKVTVVNNGPLLIDGIVDMVDQDAHAYGLGGRTKIGLCRCGASERKPFCDGSHKKSGFQSTVQAHELPPPPAKS